MSTVSSWKPSAADSSSAAASTPRVLWTIAEASRMRVPM